RAGHAVAGIVDQPVHLQAALVQRIAQPLNRRRVGEIVGQHRDLGTMLRAQVVGQALQALDAARRQHQIVAQRGQLPGELRADAGGRASDQAERACRCHRVFLGSNHILDRGRRLAPATDRVCRGRMGSLSLVFDRCGSTPCARNWSPATGKCTAVARWPPPWWMRSRPPSRRRSTSPCSRRSLTWPNWRRNMATAGWALARRTSASTGGRVHIRAKYPVRCWWMWAHAGYWWATRSAGSITARTTSW